MLKNIPSIIPPELLKVLAEMGTGDAIALVNANYGAASTAKDSILVRCDGVNVPELLEAILTLMPLDTSIEDPVLMLDRDSMGDEMTYPIWEEFKTIVAKNDERGGKICCPVSSARFYTMARSAYCVVATGDRTPNACLVIQKGDVC